MALTVELTEAWWIKYRDKDLDKTVSAAYEKAVKDYQKCNGALAETDRALDELLKAARNLHKEIDKDLKALQKNAKKSADEKNREKKLIDLNKVFGGDFVREVGKARDALNAAEDSRAKAEAKGKDAKPDVKDAKADEKDAKSKDAKPDAKDAKGKDEKNAKPDAKGSKPDEKDAKGKDAKDEDDDDDAALPRDAQAEYLRKMFPKLKSKTHSFALAMPSNDPADMRFLFHLTKQPASLAGALRKATKATLVSFGRAGIGDLADEHDITSKSGTLDLAIESKLIPQLAKRARMMLKALDAGALKKVRILDLSGKVLDSDDDSTDGAKPGALPKNPLAKEAKAVKGAAAVSGGAALDPAHTKQNQQLLERIKEAEALVRQIDLDGDKLNRLLMQLGAFKADLQSKEVDFVALQRLLQIVAALAAQGRKASKDAAATDPAEARNAALTAKLDERHALTMKMPERTEAERKAKAEALRKIGEVREKIGRTGAADAVEKDIATVAQSQTGLERLLKEGRIELTKRLDTLAERAKALGPEADQKELMALVKAARESISTDLRPDQGDPLEPLEIAIVFAEADISIDELRRDLAAIGLPAPQASGAAAVGAMKNDAFFKTLFVNADGSEKTNPQGQKLLDNLKSQITLYDKHFKADADPVTANAMKMLMMLKAAGRQAAGKENLANQATFTKKLLQYHGEDLMESLDAADSSGPDKNTLRASLQLLHGLVSDDPMRPYMEKEIKTQERNPSLAESEKVAFEKVVERISDMAARAGIKTREMLGLLEQAHQVEVGCFSLDEVTKGKLKNVDPSTGDAPKQTFYVENVTGEISPEYFGELLDLKNGKPQWSTKSGLVYSDTAKKKIDRLRDAASSLDSATKSVAIPSKTLRLEKPSVNLSKKQEDEAKAKHGAAMKTIFDQIRDGSARARLSRPNDRNFVPPPGYSGGAATAEEQKQFDGGITEKQYRFLRGVVRDELAAADDSDPAEARRTVVAEFATKMSLSNEEAEQLFDRCKTYLENVPMTITCNAENMFNENGTLRYTKDYLTEQVRGKAAQSDADRFGAAEATDRTVGFKPGETEERGDQYPRWRREKDERETGGNQFLAQENAVFGAVNINFPKTSGGKGSSYGTDHLIMRDSIKPVTTFCYTTGGKERRDMSLILQDMLADGKRGLRYLALIASNASGDPKPLQYHELDLEFHCYGPIDLTRDVKQIALPSPDAAGSPEQQDVRDKRWDEEEKRTGETLSRVERKAREKERVKSLNDRVEKFSRQTPGMKTPIQWQSFETRPDGEKYTVDPQGGETEAMFLQAAARTRFDPDKQPDLFACEVARRSFDKLDLNSNANHAKAEEILGDYRAALKRAAADKAVDRKRPPLTELMDNYKTRTALLNLKREEFPLVVKKG